MENELRLNNLIQVKYWDGSKEVCEPSQVIALPNSIYCDHDITCALPEGVERCSVEFLPISQDVLEQLGFTKSEDSSQGWEHRQLGVEYMISSKKAIIKVINTYTLFKIEYVHELQNLYHLITKKEIPLENFDLSQ